MSAELPSLLEMLSSVIHAPNACHNHPLAPMHRIFHFLPPPLLPPLLSIMVLVLSPALSSLSDSFFQSGWILWASGNPRGKAGTMEQNVSKRPQACPRESFRIPTSVAEDKQKGGLVRGLGVR